MIKRIHNYLRRAVNYTDKSSPAYRYRRKRMDIFECQFEKMFGKSKDIIKILDVGGTLSFWTVLDFKYINRVHITLLNVEAEEIPENLQNIFVSIAGDATNMSEFKDNSFDLVFSNSVIEHVGDFEAQRKMMQEMKRISTHRYIQTPNRYFPIEPHYGFPLFQFFPMKLKVYMVQHYKLRCERAVNAQEAYEIASGVRLMKKKDLERLLPNEVIHRERVFGFTKSFYVFF